MKHLAILLYACFFLNNLWAQSLIQWQKPLGGSNSEGANSIQKTNDGGFIIIGTTYSDDGDVSGFHGGLGDVWVVKLSAGGTLEWQRALGGSDIDLGSFVEQTGDGGYIIAGSTRSTDGDVSANHGNSDCWVVKLNGAGELEWQKTYGGTGEDFAKSVCTSMDGGYVVAGRTSSEDGDVSNNYGHHDFWVFKLDVSGALQWQKTFGGSDYDGLEQIQLTIDGKYIVLGNTRSTDGNISGAHGGEDVWVGKLNSEGTLLWQQTLGGSQQDRAVDIRQTIDHGYILAGLTASDDGDVSVNQGKYDCWVVKITSIGTLHWEKTFGGSDDDTALSVATTEDGGYMIAGNSKSTDGDVTDLHGTATDIWMLKLNLNGDLEWQKTYGGSEEEVARSVYQTNDGGYIVAGEARSTDGDVSGIQGFKDFWVFKLSSSPVGVEPTLHTDAGSLHIFPNPTRQQVFIKTFSGERVEQVRLFDVLCRSVLYAVPRDDGSLDISALNRGEYFLWMSTSSGKVFTGTISKE